MVQLGEAAACVSDLLPSIHHVVSCDCCARMQFAAFLTPGWDYPLPRPSAATLRFWNDNRLPLLAERFGHSDVLSFKDSSQRSTRAYWRPQGK